MSKKPVRGPSQGRQKTEARILRGAEKVFASMGYSGSSMEAIARESGLSKQNLIYYYSSKKSLYRTVLHNVLDLWMENLALIEEPGASPSEVMRTYIRLKIEFSRENPDASKVFAHEIINGAPMLETYLLERVKPQFDRDVAIINGWIKDGLVKPLAAEHMIFTIWASTQTYADFATQTCILLGKEKLENEDFERACEFITSSILSAFLEQPS